MMNKAATVCKALQRLPLIYGRDCSEYAGDLVSMFGSTVTMRTIRVVDKQSHNGVEFYVNTNYVEHRGPYIYHTIVTFTSCGVEYVADRLHPNLVVPCSLYIKQLKMLNKNSDTCDYIMYKGEYDTLSLRVNTVEKLKKQRIRVTYI